MTFLIPFIFSILTTTAPAKTPSTTVDKKDVCDFVGSDIVFPKNYKMRIESYHPETDSFEVASFDMPGEGTLDVTSKALFANVKDLSQRNPDSIRNNPDDVVGEVFVPETSIPSLLPKELKDRSVCAWKNKK